MIGPRDAYDVYYEIRNVTDFTVTSEHLNLLRRAYVSWDGCEFGAPEIDCKRPYGNGDVLSDIAEVLDPDGIAEAECDDAGDDALDAYYAANEARFIRVHAETALALQIGLRTGKFETGRFSRPKYSSEWQPAEGSKS